MALLQAALIGLISLILTPGYFFYFDITPKLILLLAGAACVCAWSGGRRHAHPRWFTLLLLLSFASLCLSTVLSANPAVSLYGASWRRYGSLTQVAILLFAGLVASRPESTQSILRAVSVSGLITALYGIAQYFGWDPFLPASAYHIGEGIWTIVRPPATLGYASYFATWLLSVIYFSLTLAYSESSAAWRRFAFATAAVGLIAMVLTGTRAAILGLLAGVVVWFFWRGFRLTRRVAVITAVLLVASVAFYYSPPGWQLRTRARWFAEDPWGGARPYLWRDSFRMAAARLPAGYGPEVFTATFPRFESRELARAFPDFAHESPHNIFLDALVSQGIPGLLLLCAFCAAGFAATWRTRNAGLAAAFAAGIVSQQFTVFTIPTALIFYTTIALAVSSVGRTPRSATGPLAGPLAPTEQADEGAGRGPGGPPHTSLIAAYTIAAALLYFAARFAVADHALALAQRNLESGNLAAATSEYTRYQHWRLPGTSADLWYSRALLGLAQSSHDPILRIQAMAQSGAAGLRATATAEDPFNAWYNLAVLYASQNNPARTETTLRAAIAAKPAWFKSHWMLAQVLRLEGRTEEALREAALAAELNGGKNPEVTRTLEEIRLLHLHK